jgi:hypothetical protein
MNHAIQQHDVACLICLATVYELLARFAIWCPEVCARTDVGHLTRRSHHMAKKTAKKTAKKASTKKAGAKKTKK